MPPSDLLARAEQPDPLERWLARRARMAQRVVFIDDALLANRFLRYAFYRLRFFFVRTAVGAGVHAVKFLILFAIFSRGRVFTIFALHAAAGLVTAWWWGALEVMRDDVRALYRSNRRHVISKEIARWLSFAAQLTAAAALVTVGWAVWHAIRYDSFGPDELYIVSIGLRLSVEFVLRCYHSGMYAIRRIWRPLTSMIGVDLAGLAGVAALWNLLGAWSFPVAAIAATLLGVGLTLRYTNRAYRFLGFAPLGLMRLRRFGLPRPGVWGPMARTALSYGIISMDAILVLALVPRDGAAGVSSAFALLFLLGPIVRAGSDWAFLFYFDLKRLEVAPFANLRAGFQRSVDRLSWPLGVVFWLSGVVIGLLVDRDAVVPFVWILLPFFLARSLLAVAQIRMFAAAAYGLVLASGLVAVAGWAACALLVRSEPEKLLAISAVTLVAYAVLRIGSRRAGAAEREVEAAWPCTWLSNLARVDGPVRVGSARCADAPRSNTWEDLRVWDEQSRWKHRLLAERIAARLGGNGEATLIEPGRVAWYERVAARPRVDAAWIVAAAAGIVESLTDTGEQPDGATALAAACAGGSLGSEVRAAWLRRDGRSVEQTAVAEFSWMFPNGIVHVPGSRPPPLLARLTPSDKHLVMLDVTTFARDMRPLRARSSFLVTTLCLSGDLRFVFMAARGGERRRRDRWLDRIRELNLQAALDGVPPPKKAGIREARA